MKLSVLFYSVFLSKDCFAINDHPSMQSFFFRNIVGYKASQMIENICVSAHTLPSWCGLKCFKDHYNDILVMFYEICEFERMLFFIQTRSDMNLVSTVPNCRGCEYNTFWMLNVLFWLWYHTKIGLNCISEFSHFKMVNVGGGCWQHNLRVVCNCWGGDDYDLVFVPSNEMSIRVISISLYLENSYLISFLFLDLNSKARFQSIYSVWSPDSSFKCSYMIRGVSNLFSHGNNGERWVL